MNKLVVFIKFVKTLAVINSSIFLPHFHSLILTPKFNYRDELIPSYRFLRFTAVLHMYANVCEVWDWRWVSYSLRQCLSLNLGFTDSARLASKPQEPSASTSPALGLQEHGITPRVWLTCWRAELMCYLCSKGFPVCADPRPSGNDPGTRHWAHPFGKTQCPSLLVSFTGPLRAWFCNFLFLCPNNLPEFSPAGYLFTNW